MHQVHQLSLLTIFRCGNKVFPKPDLLYPVLMGYAQRTVGFACVRVAVSQQVGVGSADMDSIHHRSHQQAAVVVSLRAPFKKKRLESIQN